MSDHLSPAFAGHAHAELAGRVARIWAGLFNDPTLTVGPEDNFFTLGGSSLLAVEMVDQLGRELAIPLSLVAIVEQPTLAELVAHIAALLAGAGAGAGDDAVEEGVL